MNKFIYKLHITILLSTISDGNPIVVQKPVVPKFPVQLSEEFQVLFLICLMFAMLYIVLYILYGYLDWHFKDYVTLYL